jgi:hypothetical protein
MTTRETQLFQGEKILGGTDRRAAGFDRQRCSLRIAEKAKIAQDLPVSRQILRRIVWLNEIDPNGTTTVGRDRKAVANLNGPAIVVPLGDRAESELPHPRRRLAQTQP